jgi:capsular polysaccharide biosynthesis protein
MDEDVLNTEGEISLSDIWNIIKRRWIWIILITTLSTLASYIHVNQIVPLYRSTATLVVQTPSSYSSMASSPMPDYYSSERWAQTYAEMLKGEPILQKVSRRTLHPKISPGELRGGLSVEAVKNTLLLRVSFTYGMKTYAKKITDTICSVFIENISEFYKSNIQSSTFRLEKQIAQMEDEIELLIVKVSKIIPGSQEYDSTREELSRKQELRSFLYQQYQSQKITEAQIMPSVKIFQEGTQPIAPVNKKFQLTMAIGFILGLFISLLLAFFLEYLDDSIKTEEDLKKLSNRRILGVIPCFGTKKEGYYMGNYSRYYIKDKAQDNV